MCGFCILHSTLLLLSKQISMSHADQVMLCYAAFIRRPKVKEVKLRPVTAKADYAACAR
jgi:hypothetical protein